MELKEGLLDIMCCPKCKGELRVSDASDGVICKACAVEYPVRGGIPVMIVSEAVEIEATK